jgi:hypothetical protein
MRSRLPAFSGEMTSFRAALADLSSAATAGGGGAGDCKNEAPEMMKEETPDDE